MRRGSWLNGVVIDRPDDLNTSAMRCQILADLGSMEEAQQQLDRIEQARKRSLSGRRIAKSSYDQVIRQCRDRLAAKPRLELASLDGL